MRRSLTRFMNLYKEEIEFCNRILTRSFAFIKAFIEPLMVVYGVYFAVKKKFSSWYCWYKLME